MRKFKSSKWQTKKECNIYFTGEETKKKGSQEIFPKIKDQVSTMQIRTKVLIFCKLLEFSPAVVFSNIFQAAIYSFIHSFIHPSSR